MSHIPKKRATKSNEANENNKKLKRINSNTSDYALFDAIQQSLLSNYSTSENTLTAATTSTCESSTKSTMTEYIQISDYKKVRQFLSSSGEFRFELRKFTDTGLSDVGVILDLDQLKELKRLLPLLQENYEECLNRGERLVVKYPLGYNVYCSINHNFLCVDIRQFFVPKDGLEPKATKRGLGFNLKEFTLLRGIIEGMDLNQYILPRNFYCD